MYFPAHARLGRCLFVEGRYKNERNLDYIFLPLLFSMCDSVTTSKVLLTAKSRVSYFCSLGCLFSIPPYSCQIAICCEYGVLLLRPGPLITPRRS